VLRAVDNRNLYVCRDAVQNYITWTNASEPLRFLVDDVEGRRTPNVQYNVSQPLLSYRESYSVVLLDRYLQPNVSSTWSVQFTQTDDY